jgi:phosphoenolpyruvate carboxykinase (ATP)
VVIDGKRHADYDADSLTENTRANYPVEFIDGAVIPSVGGHPKVVVFLTADAFGVLPPIARLTPEQAMFHFLSGYTAKLAGTERGVTEPQATFSTCFAAPFLVQHPKVYADLLGRKVAEHKSAVWLVNTGWSGGPYGVGQRMPIRHTRAMVAAVLGGTLKDVPTEVDPIFGVHMPVACPGVPPEVLRPRSTWSDKGAYDAKARELAQRFQDNFKQFAGVVEPAVRAAGPQS